MSAFVINWKNPFDGDDLLGLIGHNPTQNAAQNRFSLVIPHKVI